MNINFLIRIQNNAEKLILLYTAIIFVYVLLRAIYVPPYYDEILNYFLYVETGDFQPFVSRVDANNHLINTTLNHLSYLLFGNSPWVLRISSTVGFILFSIFLWKIRKFFKSKFTANCFYLTFVSCFYFISFFSLARGYGISMTFLIISIYFLLKYKKNNDSASLFFGVIAVSLALWSNLSLLFLCTIILLFFLLISFQKTTSSLNLFSLFQRLSIMIILGGTPLFFAIKYTFLLKESGSLYLGNSAGFYESVIINLPHQFSQSKFWGIAIFSIWLSFFIIILFWNKKNKNLLSISTLFLFIFIFTIGGSVFLHILLGVNYPRDRAAIHFFVIFVFSFYFFLDNVKKDKLKYLGIFPVLVFSTQLLLSLNLTYTPCWRLETANKSFYEYLEKDYIMNNEIRTYSIPGFLARPIEHFDYLNDGHLNSTQESDYPSPIADYLIVNSQVFLESNEEFDTVVFEEKTSVTLLRRKNMIKWKTKVDTLISDYSFNSPFHTLSKFYINETNKQSIAVEIDFELKSNISPNDSWLVCSIDNDKNENIIYEHIKLKRVKHDFSAFQRIHKKFYFSGIPNDALTVNIYIWNMNQYQLEYKNCHLQYMTEFTN